MKRHVFVKFSPLDIGALSGTVTSAIMSALSSQSLPEDAPVAKAVPVLPGVPGVVVVDESGVDGGGVSVGKAKPGLVGGRVDVTKIALVGTGVSSENVMHELRLRLVSRSNVQIFFISGFYLGNMRAGASLCAGSLLR